MQNSQNALRVLWAGILTAAMVIAACIQLLVAPQPAHMVLFDGRADALLDVWCLAHVVFGIILAGSFQLILRAVHPPRWWSTWFMLVMTIVVGWELFEFSGERGIWGEWFRGWLNGYEFWVNRYFVDPGCAVIGCMIWRRYPRCFWPVVVIGLSYEVANLMAPTANTFQNWMFGS